VGLYHKPYSLDVARSALKDIFLKVLRASSLESLQEGVLGPSSVSIGNFDGCHRGHQLLLKAARDLAATTHTNPTVLTFTPHPREFFMPEECVPKLFQPEQKIRALREQGIETLVIQNFDRSFSQLSPEDFCEHLLKRRLQASALVIGEDFRFGARRAGTIDSLKRLSGASRVEVIPQYLLNGRAVSSSEIRSLLLQNRLLEANELLGRPYLLEGPVKKGQQLGRKLGFATANIDVQGQMLPGNGVYAAWALRQADCPIFTVARQRVPCVLNIGVRPTVALENARPSVEVHLLEGSYEADELYGEAFGIYLCEFIRPEARFPSLDTLKEQIRLDCQTARDLLSRTRWG
jgi:riboflavin kinase/FMN adenylyltransferase